MNSWPHAPSHWVVQPGTYMVTAATYKHVPHLASPARKTLFLRTLWAVAQEFGWQLHAWVVLNEHYHFMATSPEDPTTLSRLINKLHMTTAKAFNQEDGTPGRRVWFQYWDSLVTYQSSYLARLKYIHLNPVKHGLAEDPLAYPWSSARWFTEHASPAMTRVVEGLKIDRVKVFEPV